MVAISHRHEIVFFPIHKNASTSLKHFMYWLDTGRQFDSETASRLGGKIHRLYPFSRKERWEEYYDKYLSIAVVRDPVKRFISAYSNRVIFHRCLEIDNVKTRLDDAGLNIRPSLNEFVENFFRYRKISSSVRRHTLRQFDYIGEFFHKIDHVIPIEKISSLESFLSDRIGEIVTFDRFQDGGPKIDVSDLSQLNQEFLRKHYERDYDMLSRYY